MPVSRLHRPSRGSRHPGRWRLELARRGRARGRASRSRPRGTRPTPPSRTSRLSRRPTTGCTTGRGARVGSRGAPGRRRSRRLAANAARAARMATARSARQMSARTKDSQSSLPAPSRAVTRTAAPTTIAMMPNPRRGARFVIAHHPPATPSAKPAAPAMTYTPLRTRKPSSAAASSTTATSERRARPRCRAVEV